MSKKVAFGLKPSARRPDADKWVGERAIPQAQAEDMKRLTIDVPKTLHRQIKVACAARGTKMADEIRAMLENHYRNNGNG